MTTEATTTEATTEVTETETTEATETVDVEAIRKEAEKWRTLSRQNEQKAKANADAAARLAEIEESQKSEAERLLDQVAKSEARAQGAEAELVRLKVAVRHGLSEAQAARLIGTTEEELDADAAEFVKMLRTEEEEVEDEEVAVTTAPKPKLKSSTKTVALNDDKLLADLKRKVGVR